MSAAFSSSIRSIRANWIARSTLSRSRNINVGSVDSQIAISPAPAACSSRSPASIAGTHQVNGNGYLGPLQLSQAPDGTLTGTIYGNAVAGHYASGTGSVARDVISGEIPVLFSATGVVAPLVRGGQLRALAVTGSQRSSALPEVPTVAESGLPGFEVSSWYGVLAPAGTPAETVGRLHAELVRILALPDVLVSAKTGHLSARPTPSAACGPWRDGASAPGDRPWLPS